MSFSHLHGSPSKRVQPLHELSSSSSSSSSSSTSSSSSSSSLQSPKPNSRNSSRRPSLAPGDQSEPEPYADIQPYTPSSPFMSADPSPPLADEAASSSSSSSSSSSNSNSSSTHLNPSTSSSSSSSSSSSHLSTSSSSSSSSSPHPPRLDLLSPDPLSPDVPLDHLRPSSEYVDALLTDLYQLTMCYAYWTQGKHEEEAVFDLFFRENPFGGEFTIFAGLEEVLRFVSSWKVTDAQIVELRRRYPAWSPQFFDWLATLSTEKLRVYALEEGTLAIARVPLIRVEGPLALCQLMETTMLVLVNYASLVCTNAARHRLAVGPHKALYEFGLRRAQGPDGAISAARYAFMGGFDATSNVKASILFGIPCVGTHAHSFVSSFLSMSDLHNKTLAFNPDALHATEPLSNSQWRTQKDQRGSGDFIACVQEWRTTLGKLNTNAGELAAFIAYAQAFPTTFLALVDTYDVLESGVHNFLCVALALHEFGYQARGIRLDSGDLAYQSKECRKLFVKCSERFALPSFRTLTIVASNDLSEAVLYSLREQGHEIDCFAVGTHLVTCRAQPALGCVFKLVSINEQPRIKISHDAAKITIPGRKEAYRLHGSTGEPVLDLLVMAGTPVPQTQRRILCRHPFDANKRVYVTPAAVVPLHSCCFDQGRPTMPLPSLPEIRHRVQRQLSQFREDHLRRLNPTPYKLSVTSDLYTFMHDLWLSETPISEIK